MSLKEYDETNLYIGYLPPSLDDDTLIQLFAPFGKVVKAKVVKDHVTGLSKGYGFVKYSDVQEAVTAIANMNGHCLDGRSIAVRVAEKRSQPAPIPGSYPSQLSYGVQYPVAAPTISSAATSLTIPSGTMQQSVQPAYSAPTFSYAPYCAMPASHVTLTTTTNITNMPHSTTDHSHIIANVPWAQRPVPLSTISVDK